MIHPIYLYQVKSPEESKGEWDYFKLVRALPGEEAFGPMNPARQSADGGDRKLACGVRDRGDHERRSGSHGAGGAEAVAHGAPGGLRQPTGGAGVAACCRLFCRFR